MLELQWHIPQMQQHRFVDNEEPRTQGGVAERSKQILHEMSECTRIKTYGEIGRGEVHGGS